MATDLVRDLEIAEIGLAVLEVTFGPRSLRKIVDLSIKTMRSFSSSLRSLIWIGQIKTKSTRGASWWWEGPAQMSYLWLLYGHVKLAFILIALFEGGSFDWNITPPTSSEIVLLIIPLLLTSISAGLLSLMWFFDLWELSDMIPTRSEVPKGKEYWHYTKRRIQRKCIHIERYRSSGIFAAGKRSQPERRYTLGRILFELIGFGLLWPSIVYLALLAIAVWVAGRLLYGISWTFGVAARVHDYLHFRLPTLGAALLLLTHFISKYFHLK